MRSRFCEAVQEMFAAEVEFSVNRSPGCTEGVVKVIECQDSVFAIMTEDHRVSIASGDIDASAGAHWRRKNEIVDSFQPERFAARFAGNWIEPGQNVLIVPQEIERVVVHQR